jgi:putative ABC transport system substrate-binding protein
MRRREFIGLVGGAAAWPVAARGQQGAKPLIGFLSVSSPDTFVDDQRGFRQGLRETGYVDGENVATEFLWAEDQHARLPELVAGLLRRHVAVIVTAGYDASVAAKAATTTIPIVFIAGDDPVRLGLVSSLARPGGNLTGLNIFVAEVGGKRLGLLHELVPTATRIAVLVNPANVTNTQALLREVEPVARALGLQVQVLNADNSREIHLAFASLAQERPDALLVNTNPFFTSRRVQLVQLAARHAIPANYGGRHYAQVGGLMSYGASLTDAYRQAGIYAGRILKGAKPTDLPVMQATKLELVINAETARMLGITVPPTLLARADEVIE